MSKPVWDLCFVDGPPERFESLATAVAFCAYTRETGFYCWIERNGVRMTEDTFLRLSLEVLQNVQT